MSICFYLGVLDISPGEYMEQVRYVFQVETRGKVCDANFIGYLDCASVNCVFCLLADLLGSRWRFVGFFDTQ